MGFPAEKRVAVELLGEGTENMLGFLPHVTRVFMNLIRLNGYGIQKVRQNIKVDETQLSTNLHDARRSTSPVCILCATTVERARELRVLGVKRWNGQCLRKYLNLDYPIDSVPVKPH